MPAKKKTGGPRKRAVVTGGRPAKRPVRKKAAVRRPPAKAEQVSVYCSRCGTTGATVRGGVPAAWSVAFEGGRLLYLCAACARANIRAIEGKLPEEWWE